MKYKLLDFTFYAVFFWLLLIPFSVFYPKFEMPICILVSFILGFFSAMINGIFRYLEKQKHSFIYGKTKDGKIARINVYTNKVEFVLWKKGEQGHKEDFYHEIGYGHQIIIDAL